MRSPGQCAPAGKNRPLDEDELDFLDTLQQQAQAADAAWRAEQERELDAYQQAGAPTVCLFSRSCKRLGMEVPARGPTGIAGTGAVAGKGQRSSQAGTQIAVCLLCAPHHRLQLTFVTGERMSIE